MEPIPAPDTYRQTVRELSDRLVEAQRPIRILDAIQWGPEVREAFFATGCAEQPRVDAAYYQARPLGFDPEEKRRQFADLERDVQRALGSFNTIGQIMRRMCREYQTVISMLEARGRPEFSTFSQELYGGASDALHAGEPTLADLATVMGEALEKISRSQVLPEEEKTINGAEAVAWLQQRLDLAFQDPLRRVRVLLSDGIVADAAAGSDYLKIRREAMFNERDLRLLEIHEGWVHLGTTFNGLAQPYCTFLAKGPPSSTVTQEGLAILMEILAFASHPPRVRRLANRIRAVHMAEQGATFLEVFGYFRLQGTSEADSFANAARVFRGSTPTGGPFTKDITYNKGFILTYNYIQLAIKNGLLDRIPMLFCGKATLEDVRSLAQLVTEGLVVPPRFLPPQFTDLNALSAWMCYSNFLNRLNLARIEADYAGIL